MTPDPTTIPATVLGCDSAAAPTSAACAEAVSAGVKVWQVYVGGPNATHTYTLDEVEVLRFHGLIPLAIWVPSFELTEDPAQAAADAIGAMEERGIYGALALDTEEEMRVSPHLQTFVVAFTGRAPGASVYNGGNFCPGNVAEIVIDWGGSWVPTGRNGCQYGPASAFGMGVDWDRYAPGFPVSSWTKPTPIAKPPPPPHQVPIVAVVARPQGDGYWLVGANGGLWAFGRADGALARTEHDRLPGEHLPAAIVAAASTPTGRGLHLVGADGSVYRLGDALALGDLPGLH